MKFIKLIDSYDCYAPLLNVILHPWKKRIALTFDDGLEDVYAIAYPYLKEKKIPFTIFIITDFLNTPGYITKEQLLEMSENPFVTIGSHGITHKVLPDISSTDKRYEIHESRQILSKLVKRDIVFFAYSHGQYDKESLKYANEYKYCLSVLGRPLNVITGLKHTIIPRFNVENATYEKINIILNRILRR
jgi:peptidoglycan/xylan/chitin deacetylase (PgdA/CDA1 family)